MMHTSCKRNSINRSNRFTYCNKKCNPRPRNSTKNSTNSKRSSRKKTNSSTKTKISLQKSKTSYPTQKNNTKKPYPNLITRRKTSLWHKTPSGNTYKPSLTIRKKSKTSIPNFNSPISKSPLSSNNSIGTEEESLNSRTPTSPSKTSGSSTDRQPPMPLSNSSTKLLLTNPPLKYSC